MLPREDTLVYGTGGGTSAVTGIGGTPMLL
jgi:hypothetical protein